MLKNKICTSLEQSKKLIELGIDKKTSDMFYWHGEDIIKIGGDESQSDIFDIPSWSLTALLKLMPKFSLEKDISNNEGYQLHYNYNTTYYDDPVDAAVEMICWLKKYKKL